MSVVTPPRPTETDERSLDERVGELEALIEEARQRARRRRRRRGAYGVLAVLAGGGLYFGVGHGGGTTTATSAARASSGGTAAGTQAEARWSATQGPDGGGADAVAIAPSDPQVVYLAAPGGVSRSTNGGGSWVSAGLPYGGPGVTSLVVDPRSPKTVYAGLNSRWAGGMNTGGAVMKTTNGGRSWHSLSLRAEPIAITTYAVYAEASEAGGTYRLVRSIDRGRSWRSARGLPGGFIWALAFAPTTPTMVAAMGRRGVFASSDGGSTWHAAGNSARYGETTAVAVDPLHPQTVYAATSAGIVVSLDGGRSWRIANATLRHHSGGERWSMQVFALLVDPHDSQTLYATTRCAGVFKSTDAGHSWKAVDSGLQPQCPWAYPLAIDPRAPQTIYAADAARGAVKSVDGGGHWQVADNGLGAAWLSSVAVDPRNPRTVYAAAGALGLFESRDGGMRWHSLPTGLVGAYSVAVDANHPAHVIVSGSTQPGTAPSSNPIAVSTDAGRSWTQAACCGGWESLVAISGRAAYAGSSTGYGVFGSTDGGHTWRKLGPSDGIYPQALAIQPGDPNVVYVAFEYGPKRGLYKTADGGRSWRRLGGLDGGGSAIALDPQDASTVYVASNESAGGVLKSTDGGATWQRESVGLGWKVVGKRKRPVTAMTALAIDPAHPTTLYAATNTGGVFKSTDAGASWHRFDAGLGHRGVTAFALSSSGRTIYAAIDGGGVSRLQNP